MKWGVDVFGKTKVDFNVTMASRLLNDSMPLHVVSLLESACAEANIDLANLSVAILGVAFLPDSDDTRNTPTLPLIKALEERKIDFLLHDPLVNQRDFEYPIHSDFEIISSVDAIIVMTKHTDYYNLSLPVLKQLMCGNIIIDGRDLYDQKSMDKHGFIYRGVGKSN